jgi:RNA recognition motif-containing protein
MPVNCPSYKLWLDKGVGAGYETLKFGVSGRRISDAPHPHAMVSLYVGNLSFKASETDLQGAFGAFGPVASVRIVKHPFNGRSLGFAFVHMEQEADARRAAAGLHNQLIADRPVRVSETRPRDDIPRISLST